MKNFVQISNTNVTSAHQWKIQRDHSVIMAPRVFLVRKGDRS